MHARSMDPTDRPQALVGTSGWYYHHWVGPFYPDDLRHEDFLSYYAERLHTVEVNNTFYQWPDPETLSHWRERVPPEFTFAVKANRYITHMKKLHDAQEQVSDFVDKVSVLEDQLGPILFQLPPNWHLDLQRLESFLDVLPSSYHYAFEFRDPSWFDERLYGALEAHGVALCIYDFHDR
jgi:uncharacterized protein YecE (DUF72 family)